MNNDYKIVPMYYGDDFSSLLELVKEHSLFVNYRYYLSKNHFNIDNNLCALALYKEETIIGATLLLIHNENDLLIGNISSTFIARDERGKGLSSLLINSAKDYCDILLNLTPVDSVINLMKEEKISDFDKIGAYQLQILYSKAKKDGNIFLKKIFDDEKENKSTFLKGALFNVHGIDVFLSFYIFKSHGFVASEIVFVSNKNAFTDYYRQIVSILKKELKIILIFIDDIFMIRHVKGRVLSNKKDIIHYFRNFILLLFKGRIKLSTRKYIWYRNNKKIIDINYLFTEFCFRR